MSDDQTPGDVAGSHREVSPEPMVSPWLTVREAAGRAKCGERSIYNATRSGKLRAARLGGRRELRFLASWIDAWLLASSTPAFANPLAPGDDGARDRIG
jgi:excisionase family DNA binding protein